MKALVTGGCGFIGSHVVDALLAQGHTVTVIDNCSTGRRANLDHVAGCVEIIEADIATPGAWMQAFTGVHAVFHLAALADIVPSIQHPEMYFASNVTGTLNVLQAARAASAKRFVYAASSSCYGIPPVYPTPETSPISPQYPYALTKWMGESLVMHWYHVYQVPAVSLRLFNVYGPRSRTSGTYGAVFGVFLAQKLAGKPFTVVGDGAQTRDFTYVTDVARAFVAAARSDRVGQIYNVGSRHTVAVNRIVELLQGDKVFIPKRPGEPDCTHADIRKITSELSWSPEVSIEEGVGQLLQHIDYWRDAPIWDPESIAQQTHDWFTHLGAAANG